MFYLTDEKMLIEVKKRTEKHGDEHVAAYDAYLSGDFSNAILLKLDTRLREVFYGPGVQTDVEEGYFPELLYPLMGPVSWGLEMGRMRLEVHDVDSTANDLVLTGKEMDKVRFAMKPGGTVTLAFRIILGQLEEDNLLKLLRIDNQKVKVSIEQSAEAEVPDHFEQAELLGQETMSEARQEAESLFSDGGDMEFKTPEDLIYAEREFAEPPSEAKRRGRPKKETVAAD